MRDVKITLKDGRIPKYFWHIISFWLFFTFFYLFDNYFLKFFVVRDVMTGQDINALTLFYGLVGLAIVFYIVHVRASIEGYKRGFEEGFKHGKTKGNKT